MAEQNKRTSPDGREAASRKLREILNRVHAKNPDADEREVVALASQAIVEVRRERHRETERAKTRGA